MDGIICFGQNHGPDRRMQLDWGAKLELFEEIRREYEFGVGTIKGWPGSWECIDAWFARRSRCGAGTRPTYHEKIKIFLVMEFRPNEAGLAYWEWHAVSACSQA